MIAALPAIPHFNFNMNIITDTIPFYFGPGFNHARNWDEWAREFESQFIEQFGCQKRVEKHEEEIQEMMKDLESFDHGAMEELADQMHRLSTDGQFHQSEEIWAQQAEQMENFGEQMGRWAEENARQFEQLEQQFKAFEDSQFVFEKEFRDELVNDGYLKKDEEIKSIEINDEVIKINGKTIKESDEKKYREIIRKNSYGPKLPPRPGRLE
jgi:hypothetical protein